MKTFLFVSISMTIVGITKIPHHLSVLFSWQLAITPWGWRMAQFRMAKLQHQARKLRETRVSKQNMAD